MKTIARDQPGERVFMLGNEAIARGLIEGGVRFCAAYPGNPSSEILETLASVTDELGIWAEWSVNEKVAMEGAAAASFAGVRAVASMKQNGVNVALDFIAALALSGVKAGTVLITCDDPGAVSSINEEDARFVARIADLPLLEPSFPDEARLMAHYALELSERLGSLVVLRSVSRLSHCREEVVLGEVPSSHDVPGFDLSSVWKTFPVPHYHRKMHENLVSAADEFETSPFNRYEGPDAPDLLVFAAGSSYLYCCEVLGLLGLEERVGIAKLSTTWPLPTAWVETQLARCGRILFTEEVDPFVEDSIKAHYAQVNDRLGPKRFFGRSNGFIPKEGEITPDAIAAAVVRVLGIEGPAVDDEYRSRAAKWADEILPPRAVGFCAGCPHRASFWSIKNALKLDDRDGFVSGDIGCYSLSLFPTGFSQSKVIHCMGSGSGVAAGFVKLRDQGFNQPVVAAVGDSTFFHAGIPPLIDAVHHGADYLLVILDNSATAMTGFQPHPGSPRNAPGAPAREVDLEALCRAVGASVTVEDPYDLHGTTETLYRLLNEEEGVRVLILRRTCALVQRKRGGFPYKVEVDPDKCRGEECGCNRYCTRVFRCPGLFFDDRSGKAGVDEVICVGCGVCAEVCPHNAIIRKEINHA